MTSVIGERGRTFSSATGTETSRALPALLDIWPDLLLRDGLTEHFLTVGFPPVPVRVWPRNRPARAGPPPVNAS